MASYPKPPTVNEDVFKVLLTGNNDATLDRPWSLQMLMSIWGSRNVQQQVADLNARTYGHDAQVRPWAALVAMGMPPAGARAQHAADAGA